MPSSKDIKEILEARKARRAIPQVDPADEVDRPPEPELAGPPATAQQPPAAVETATLPPAGSVVIVAPDDPRTQPVPPGDTYTVTSLKLRQHQYRQLKAEKFHRDIDMPDIMETALEEYFMKRYRRQGRGQRQ
jgi:hypothetical protein